MKRSSLLMAMIILLIQANLVANAQDIPGEDNIVLTKKVNLNSIPLNTTGSPSKTIENTETPAWLDAKMARLQAKAYSIDTFEMPKLEQTDARYAAQLHRFNDYNRQVFQAMHAEALRGDGVVISMTDRFRETDYGQPVVALKSYIMSPFSDEQYVQAVVDSVERARKQVAGVFK